MREHRNRFAIGSASRVTGLLLPSSPVSRLPSPVSRLPSPFSVYRMFYRLLFLLLVAFNIGVAAWLVFGPAPVAPLPAATDRGVPELKLLSERPGTTAQDATPRAPVESRAARPEDRCQSIG